MPRSRRSFATIAAGLVANEAATDDSPKHRSKLSILVLIVILSVSSVLYYAALAPERFGSYHDDSIYATTARALANGQGYRIISLPSEPAQTKYPPFYPLLLSLIWKAHSQFPQNVVWMTMLSCLAALSFLALTYRYLTSRGYSTPFQALIVVGLAAANWRTIILATGMYSEMLFAALSVAALCLAERDASKEGIWFNRLLLGIILGLAFLTRTSGLVLLLSVGIYYALHKRWRAAAAVMFIGGLFVLGWVWWCYVNKTNVDGINTAYYTSYLGHLKQTVADMQASGSSSALTAYLKIILTNFIGGVLVSVPLVCSGLNYGWMPSFGGSSVIAVFFLLLVFLVLVMAFVKHISRGVRLLHVYLISSFAIYLLWLPGVAYDRFMMPLLPFLLVFLVSGFDLQISLARRELSCGGQPARKMGAAFIMCIFLAAIGLGLYSYGAGVYWVFATSKSSVRAEEDAQASAWIAERTDPSETLVCYRDPKYFLYTGHKAVRSLPMAGGYSWGEDDVSMSKLAAGVFRIIEEANARYLVVTSTDFELEDNPEQHRKTFNLLIERHPQKFILVFKSFDSGSRIYRIQSAQT